MIKRLKTLALSLVILALISACSTTHKSTQSLRSATEQLLLSEAVIRSLPKQQNNPLSIPQGANVILGTTGITGANMDEKIVQEVMAGWLGQHGYHVQHDANNAAYKINVIVGSLGTELGGMFFGIPPVSGSLLPISLPELALFKAQHQTGYAKFHIDIFEIPSGRFVQSTPAFLAETHYNDYTILFVFSFNKTDLISPPQLGNFRSPIQTQTEE